VWWGVEQYRFPYLSVAAKQILVIQGSSAESERHFSTAGKVTSDNWSIKWTHLAVLNHYSTQQDGSI